MNPESQRIAIAEACGWTYTKTVNNPDPTPYGRWPEGLHPKLFGNTVEWDVPLPNYLGDLNAMHEAEKVLTEDQIGIFDDKLRVLVIRSGAHSQKGPAYKMWHATAAQRAEAFLKTIGKWEESA